MLHLSCVLVAKPFQSCVYYVVCFFLIPGCLCVCAANWWDACRISDPGGRGGCASRAGGHHSGVYMNTLWQPLLLMLCRLLWFHLLYTCHVCVRRKKLTLNFLRCLKKNYQRFQSKSQVCVFFSISVINVQHANAKNLFFYVSVREKAKKKPELLAM